MVKYRIELIWNREFNWSIYGDGSDDLDITIKLAKSIRDSGDGARIKKIRVIENDNDQVKWNG